MPSGHPERTATYLAIASELFWGWGRAVERQERDEDREGRIDEEGANAYDNTAVVQIVRCPMGQPTTCDGPKPSITNKAQHKRLVVNVPGEEIKKTK